ncbi:TPA: VanZ family protein, partial [Enterococcus faecium]|nr:VanZ family protein [Enterococcus faecium]HAQ3980345.1 VanZ family protein [Enterococcus faecium]HCC1513528.1 VanZ family protein [Enterococcus faecium]HCR3522924.1 VanZ family protein [Enterococcus faecium]HCR3653140.1 VanZ family protein [Enterococcus faecium]
GGKIAFYFSAIIEFLQLFLRLGTFQISDFVYNTLGGILGVILYKLILITKRDGER